MDKTIKHLMRVFSTNPPAVAVLLPLGKATLFHCLLSKCTEVKIYSFWSHIRDHFVLELKSRLKNVESTLKKSYSNPNFGVDSTINLERIQSKINLPLIVLQKVDSTYLHQEIIVPRRNCVFFF